MHKVSDFKRIMECMKCEYMERCFNTVSAPEEYENGTCRTKDVLKERDRRMEQHEPSDNP